MKNKDKMRWDGMGWGGLRESACLSYLIFSYLLEVARRQDRGQGGFARILEADQGQLQLLVEEEANGGRLKSGRGEGARRETDDGEREREGAPPLARLSHTHTSSLTCAASPAATGTRRSSQENEEERTRACEKRERERPVNGRPTALKKKRREAPL
jgi:hypothetical protein